MTLGIFAVACHGPANRPGPARGSAPAPSAALPATRGSAAPAPVVLLSRGPEPSPGAAIVPYDLSADRTARIAEARAELGATVPTAIVREVFVVVGAPGWTGSAFAQSVALVRDALDAYMNGRFKTPPPKAITVYLFGSSAPYEAYCKKRWEEKCLSKYGFYRPDERRMVMNAGLGLGTLTHELVHPIVESDFPSAPTWLNEGIASLFEAPSLPKKGEIHGVRNWRHPRLVSAFGEPKERPTTRLDSLFGMDDDTFRDNAEDLHYAMARYVCQWLDGKDKLWSFYQTWRDGAAEDPTGVKAFSTVMGRPPGEVNEAWVKWVKGL